MHVLAVVSERGAGDQPGDASERATFDGRQQGIKAAAERGQDALGGETDHGFPHR